MAVENKNNSVKYEKRNIDDRKSHKIHETKLFKYTNVSL